MSQQINLFNPAFLQQKKRLTATRMAVALGVLAGALAAAGLAASLRADELQAEAARGAARLAQAQKRLDQVSAEFARRRQDPQLAVELARAQSELLDLQEVARSVESGELGDTSGYAEYFRALARQSVDGLWLTGVSIGSAGRDIAVRGRALDPALVPAYLGRLRSEPVMQGKPVASLQIGEAAGEGKPDGAPVPYVEFSLQSLPQKAEPGLAGGRP